MLVLLGLTACGQAERDVVASASSALTAAECNFFDVNGTVRICHATPSAKKPYTIVQVSNSGCVNGHASHPNDYVATAGDPDCKGGGCFPVGAPVDPTIPCCELLVARNGVCTDLCAGVVCAPLDQCHLAGTCNPTTGRCSNPVTGADSDGDGIPDACDNCPSVYNPDQSDTDGDGIGDACDPDLDGDGVPNERDNCPDVYNPDQRMTYPAGSPQNPKGLGDACNPDIDGDGVPNAIDNCPLIYNPAQDPGDPARFAAEGLHCT